ncbi:hypothetical protein AVEN_130946-1 [Araneus ventricosus]|uniref:Uncharacterized protein n=1 Tax=Araneus ventricosus TaxID=182803 RepID=A0A4Y2R778_ARAVE|nr:hypothetical protein AVEN_130946-1 [Araneus ventricosus]
MTAYVLRFCNNIKRNSPKLVNSLSCEEIQKAEETLIKIMQSEWPSEIREKYKDTIQFFEENGILKVQTRLILSQDPEDHQGTDVAAQNPGPTAADVLEEVKKSRCGRPLIPVKRLNL